MRPLFAVIRHKFVLERIHEIETDEVVLGRSADCGICLPDISVSRMHAKIAKRAKKFFISDQKSCNGTFLNNRAIVEEEVLIDESIVGIGPYSLTMCFSKGAMVRHTSGVTDDSTVRHNLAVKSHENHRGPHEYLTDAQRGVFELLIVGDSEKEVAAKLGIAVNTVHVHARAIYKRLLVSTRGELILLAMRWASAQ